MGNQGTITSFFIESLGCAKNTVDSHAMEKILVASGYKACLQPEQADVIIVNTCGFIQPAKQESIKVLKEFASNKRKNQYLVAAGCLSEREKSGLESLVSGLDAAISTRRWVEIVKIFHQLERETARPYLYFPETESILPFPNNIPGFAVQGKSAYLKIADGCDRGCSYCAIPLIKGPMVSRSENEILNDALILERAGIREIVLIAQDTTAYGRDFGLNDGLPHLLNRLLDWVPGIPWIRIMYTFPGSISDALIDVIKANERILSYIDIPLQHAHPEILKQMHRPADMDKVKHTLKKMRSTIPELALRTTFIVGFPNESEEEHRKLVDFVEEIEFDHVGIFQYYHESGTPAYKMEDTVSEAEKSARIQNLAQIQEDISLKKNQSFIGQELEVLIEGNGDGISIGRSYRDAPEIDGLVLVQEIIEPGELVNVNITGALIHDLVAETQK